MKNKYTNRFRWLIASVSLSIILALNAMNANAQVNSTLFSKSLGTYTPITGGTIVSASCTDDDNQYAVQPIGFNFGWNGGVHTQIGINANGWIALGGTAVSSFTGGASNYLPLPGTVTSTTQGNIIAAFAFDLQGKATPCGEVRIQTIGTAPNRTCVVQWSNFARWSSASTGLTDTLNFQIRLTETGTVNFVYGYMATSGSIAAQIGMNGIAPADFVTRTGTFDTLTTAGLANTSTMTMTNTNKPVSGLTYSWTFPPQVFSSVTTTTAPGSAVLRGGINQTIIRVEVTTSGSSNPLILSQLNLSTNGSTTNTNISAARVFYTGTTNSFNNTTQFGNTITSLGTSFNVTGSQALANGVNYFWLVYDISPTATLTNVVDGECSNIIVGGVSYVPNVIAPPGNKQITGPLSGSYTVGSSGNYPTITAALADLTSLGASSAVIFNLIDPVYSTTTGESFPLNVPNYNGMSPANNLTIRPASGNPNPLINDSNATSIFILNGAKYVRIQGVNSVPSTARGLTIQNRSTAATAAVIRLINEATSNSITNTIIRGANNSNNQAAPTFGSVYVGGTTNVLGSGNDSIIIRNNTFARAAFNPLDSINPTFLPYAKAISFDGQSAVLQNDNAQIDSNNIYGYTHYAINISSNNSGNGGNFRILGNSIYDTASLTILVASSNCGAIYFNPSNINAGNNIISGNFIGGLTPQAGGSAPAQPKQAVVFPSGSTFWNFYAIWANASQSSTTTISNNVVRNFWFPSTSTYGQYPYFSGIYLNTGAYDVLNNTIGNPNDTANILVESLGQCGLFYGIYSFAGGVLNIKNNVISAVKNPNAVSSNGLLGIYSFNNNSAVCNIDSNTISRFWTNSTSTSGFASTCGAFTGIYSSNASPNVSIRGNIIGGANPADSISLYNATGGKFYGIYAIGGIQNISNNRVQNVYIASNSAGSTTSASFLGIYQGSGTNGQIVNNNIVRDIRSYTFSGFSSIGIFSGSGAATVNNNQVSNFNIASNANNTLTAAAINGILVTSAQIHTVNNNNINNLNLTGHPTNGVGQINGIYTQVSNGLTLSGNNVNTLVFNGPGAGSINGIYNATAGVNQVLSQNTVTNLISNDTSNNSQTLNGIFYQSSTQLLGNSSTLTRNLVNGLSLAYPATGTPTGSVINGIQVTNGLATVTNNIVRVGRDSLGTAITRAVALRGMLIGNSSGQLRVYHNNIIADGAPNYGAINTAALEITATPVASSFAFTDVRNNILVNNNSNGVGTGNHYNIMYPAQLFSTFNGNNVYTITSDFNLHFNAATGNSFVGRFNATNYTDLNSLRTAAGTLPNLFLQEGSSGYFNPNFGNATGSTSASNLNVISPTPIEGNGDSTIASVVTTDFAGNTRTGAPDIGATGGTFTLSSDVFGPAIYFNPVLNTSSPANRVIQATVYDNGQLPSVNAPRIYFQKRAAGGGSTAWFSAAGVPVSGSTRNRVYNFTIDHVTSLGGLSLGDSVFYYIIAQDSSAGNLNSRAPYALAVNVSTVTVPPVAPNFYRLTNPIPTTIFVGTGAGSPSFTSLTGPGGAFEAINNNTLTGNLNILVQSSVTTEDGTNSLNTWFESGAGGYSVTIRPIDNNQYTLAGTTANTQGLFRFNGLTRLNLLGFSTTGTLNDTNLILRFNGSSTAIPTVAFTNGGSLDTISNVIFEGRNTGTGAAAGIVNINATTTTVGLSNVVFRNSHFRTELTASTMHAVGLFAQGTAPRFNSNISVNNCFFYNFTNNGVFFTTGNANGLSVTNSHFYYNYTNTGNSPYSGTNTMNPILINPGSTSDGNTVSNNWIGGSAPFASGGTFAMSGALSFTGINLTTGIATGTTVNRNVIQNITLTSTSNTLQHTGINVTGTGSVYAITNNRIGSLSAAITSASNHRYVGIASTATGNVTITGDTVLNIQVLNTGTTAAITGINVTTGSSNVTNISNNFISNLITTSSNTSTTTAAALSGITLTSSSLSQTIANNRIQTLVNQTAASHSMNGIWVSAGSNVINNNSVFGLNSRTTSTSTTTIQPLVGIMCTAGTTGPQTITNNTVDSVWLTTTGTTSSQMSGISIFNTFGQVTATGNTVRNLNSASTSGNTGSASGLIGMIISTPSAVNSNISQNTVSVLNHLATTSAFNIYGMWISTSTALVGNNTTVSRNFVHSLRTTSTGSPVMMGIVNLQGFATYTNNMIRLGIDSSGTAYTTATTIRGLWHQASTQANYYHNSILIAGAPTTGALNTSAFETQNQITAGQTLDVRNNIFANTTSNNGATGFNFGVRYQDSLRITSNYNLIFTPGTGGIAGGIILSGARYDVLGYAMPSWKGIVGLDMASGASNPNFDPNATGPATVATLALQNNTPAERSGDASVSGVTVDYFGVSRSSTTPVDIGAVSGNNNQTPDVFPPVVTLTPLPNAGSISGTRALNGVVITDNNGIPTSGPNVPRVYYSRDGLTWLSTPAVSITGTATNAVANFSIDYNLITPALSASDTIRYYVAAQDLAGNVQSAAPYAVGLGVNAITAAPVNPNRYNFLPVIPANTVIPVGIGQTYTNLTNVGGLFDFLNNSTLGGNVTVEITSDLLGETGAVPLRQLAEDGPGAGSFTLTIRPNAATTTPRLIEGNVDNSGLVNVGSMINLLGANRIKIQGIPTGGVSTARMLRIRNLTNANSGVITVSSATGVLLNNLIIESGNPNTAGGPVEFKVGVGGLFATTPCSLDTVNNCFITNNTVANLPAGVPGSGIYSFGQPNVYNNNIVISNNEVSNFTSFGVNIAGNNADGFRVTGNSVYYNLPFYPLTTGNHMAISLQPGNFSNNNVVTGNFVGGSAANCGGSAWFNNQPVSFNGIRVAVGNAGTTIVQNNTVQNVNFPNQTGFNQLLGIAGTAGSINISNNQVGHPTITNSIQFGQQTTHYGILYQGGNNITCNNNNVQGIFINAPAVSATIVGILINGGTLLGANNNIVGSASVPNSIVNNTTGSTIGMQFSLPASTSPTYTVSGNTISNITGTGTQPTVITGGMLFSSNSGAPTVTNNTIRNITSNTTNLTTTGAVYGINTGLTTGTIGNFTNNTISGIRALSTTSAATIAVGFVNTSGQGTLINANRIFDVTNASTSTSTLTPVPVAAGVMVTGALINTFITNNQITLGTGQTGSIQYNGIWVQTNNTGITINAFNNSVLIDGAASGGAQNSYAFLRGNNSGTEMQTWLNLDNNIFANRRTGGSGSHYAIANQTTSPTNNFWNNASSNNNLLVTANTATVGQWGLSDNSVALWRTNSLSDNFTYSVQSGTSAGQLNLGNLFTDIANGNLGLVSANQEVWYVFGKGISGNAINNLATDYAGTSRSTSLGTPTTIGSIQLNAVPSTLPYVATASAAPAGSTTTTYTFANRTVASIAWGTNVPTSISVYDFTGARATTSPAGNSNARYVRADVSGGTTPYNMGVTLNYDPAYLGGMQNPANFRIASATTLTTPVWTNQVTSANVGAFTATANALSLTGSNLLFSGTELNAAPSIAYTTPTSRAVGQSVTIVGSLFTGASALSFNGTPQPTFTVVNDTTITANVPSGATTGPISVTNPFGTTLSSFNFTVIQAPTITSFAPAQGTIGTAVTVTGTNFTSISTVQVGTVNASFTINNPTTIIFNIPSGATTNNINITNPAGTGTSSSTLVVLPAPTVTSYSPTSGPIGTLVTINGSNFNSITGVTFNGVAASYTVNSTTSITATVPVGSSTGAVAVINGSGTGTGPSFTVTTPPTITSLTPSAGGPGTVVTLTGTNFIGTTGVQLNSVAVASFSVVNATTITAVVAGANTSGVFTVITPSGTATSPGTFTVYPNLTVSTTSTVFGGPYSKVFVTATGNAILGANIQVFDSVLVNSGGRLDFAGNNILGTATFTAQGGSTLSITSPQGISLSGIAGNIQSSGARSFSATANYSYTGTSAQVTGNGLPATVNKFNINNLTGVTLTNSLTVSDTLNLIGGRLNLGANNLTIASTGAIIGANGLNYVVTNGSGALRRTIANTATDVAFPVGNNQYSPTRIQLTVGSTTDVFTVRSIASVLTGGLTGSPITTGVVNRTWDISEAIAGGSSATISVSWDDSIEFVGFNRAQTALARYTTSWSFIPVNTFAPATFVASQWTRSRSGITTFGQFTVGDNSSPSPVPVEFLSFTAKANNNDVNLDWATAMELDNKGFDIERSTDGRSFETINFVEGKGNSNAVVNYNSIDENAFAKTNTNVLYYRLKQLDNNGDFTYTNTVKVVRGSDDITTITAYPNPFAQTYAISFDASTEGEASIVMVDIQGKVVSQQVNVVAKGRNTFEVTNIAELQAGIYFARLTVNGETHVMKVVKH